jgi:hypothetical protein
MKNYAYLNREQLTLAHYVRIASPNTDYWVDFSYGKMQKYLEKGDDFFLIIIGDKSKVGDFYSIPFKYVAHLFSLDSLYQEPRKRWIASIVHHQLQVRNASATIDVGEFYGAAYLLESTYSNVFHQIKEQEQNDYAIENRRIEIEGRQKQSVFRRRVLRNFEYKCCISGISEQDLLIASHIVPWADRIDSRLDPANGLCLFVLYDKLFELGYMTLDDQMRVLVADSIDFSQELRAILQNVAGKRIAPPKEVKINLKYIRHHRKFKFKGDL